MARSATCEYELKPVSVTNTTDCRLQISDRGLKSRLAVGAKGEKILQGGLTSIILLLSRSLMVSSRNAFSPIKGRGWKETTYQ